MASRPFQLPLAVFSLRPAIKPLAVITGSDRVLIFFFQVYYYIMVVTAAMVFLFLSLIIVLNHFDMPYFFWRVCLFKKKLLKTKHKTLEKVIYKILPLRTIDHIDGFYYKK